MCLREYQARSSCRGLWWRDPRFLHLVGVNFPVSREEDIGANKWGNLSVSGWALPVALLIVSASNSPCSVASPVGSERD